MEDPQGIRGIRKGCRHDQVWREQVGHSLPDGRTRNVGKSIPTGTVGTSGAWKRNLRADDQVWRILGEIEVFAALLTSASLARAGEKPAPRWCGGTLSALSDSGIFAREGPRSSGDRATVS